MNHFEIERQKFKPKEIIILFVAESPPQGGKFFYFKNSNLYSALLNAFKKVFTNITDNNFLEEFKAKGCYLEDLCLEPVNGLDDFERVKFRMDGIPILEGKLREYKPKVLVTIMKDISPYVDDAILKSKIKILHKDVASFPVRSQTNIDNCINTIEKVLRMSLNLKYINGV